MAMQQISMYIPELLLEKADGMCKTLRLLREFEHMSEMNRSEVIRVAISEGLQVLEKKLEEKFGENKAIPKKPEIPKLISWMKDEFNMLEIDVLIGEKMYTYHVPNGFESQKIERQIESGLFGYRQVNAIKRLASKMAENTPSDEK